MSAAPKHDTSRWMGKVVKFPPAKVETFVIEGRVRTAMVRCCFCGKLHAHVVPEDITPSAPLVRTAKCKGGRDYRLVPPGEWVEEHENSGKPQRSRRKREDLTGQRFGKLIVLCDGPELAAGDKTWRQVFVQCDCGNVSLIRTNSGLKQGRIRSCGCSRGRPVEAQQQYEAWLAQAN